MSTLLRKTLRHLCVSRCAREQKRCLDLAIGVLRALFEKAPVRQGTFGAKLVKRQLFFDAQIFLFRIQKISLGVRKSVRQGFKVVFFVYQSVWWFFRSGCFLAFLR